MFVQTDIVVDWFVCCIC